MNYGQINYPMPAAAPGGPRLRETDDAYAYDRVVASPATHIRIGCQEVFIVVDGDHITLYAMDRITQLNQAEFGVVCSALNQAARDLSRNIAARSAEAP